MAITQKFRSRVIMPVRTRKRSKTAAELETGIKLEMETIGRWLPDIVMTVLPDGASWKVVFPRDIPVDSDRCETIMLIADRLRTQFDLKR
jgi:hypothetical protein